MSYDDAKNGPSNKDITLRLGFAGRGKRDYEKPSRALIRTLFIAWAGLTLLSFLIGLGAGITITSSEGSSEIVVVNGTRDDVIQDAFGMPDQIIYVDESRTGQFGREFKSKLPCWVYGDVKIYFKKSNVMGEYEVSHWTGDLDGLIESSK